MSVHSLLERCPFYKEFSYSKMSKKHPGTNTRCPSYQRKTSQKFAEDLRHLWYKYALNFVKTLTTSTNRKIITLGSKVSRSRKIEAPLLGPTQSIFQLFARTAYTFRTLESSSFVSRRYKLFKEELRWNPPIL